MFLMIFNGIFQYEIFAQCCSYIISIIDEYYLCLIFLNITIRSVFDSFYFTLILILIIVNQERIQDGYPAYPVSIGQSVVSIITSLMGSPPDMHIIVAVCDFLLYVHPAANTYISCTQSGFYFKLWWGQCRFVCLIVINLVTEIKT